MEIFLSSNCESFTGSLGRGFGYFIVRRKNGFFSVRSRHSVPPDGHWNLIVSCAQIAKAGLHISDIKVSRDEVMQALKEARIFKPRECFKLEQYNARQLINLKITFSL